MVHKSSGRKGGLRGGSRETNYLLFSNVEKEGRKVPEGDQLGERGKEERSREKRGRGERKDRKRLGRRKLSSYCITF